MHQYQAVALPTNDKTHASRRRRYYCNNRLMHMRRMQVQSNMYGYEGETHTDGGNGIVGIHERYTYDNNT
jgi:hypothetical protein